MKIGMITDSLGELSFDDLLGTAAELGIERLEFAAGNWSRAPHLALDRMLDSAPARESSWPGCATTAFRSAPSTAPAIRCIRARREGGIGRSRARRSRSPVFWGRTGGHDVGLPGWAGRCQRQLGDDELAARDAGRYCAINGKRC